MKKLSLVLKFIVGWVAVFLVRLLPFRPANFEPMLSVMMPFSKRYGAVGGFVFGFLGIALFDVAVGKVGMWTLITAVAYGLLGVTSHYYLRSRTATTKNFVIFGVAGTLMYDAVTGLSVGPLFFGQSFMAALLGQVPFTISHLIGTVVFSLVLSPAIYRWIVVNKKFDLFGRQVSGVVDVKI